MEVSLLTRSALTKAHTHRRFDLGRAALAATLFSKPENWSLSQLYHADPAVVQDFGMRLGSVLYDLRIGRALAPSPVEFTDRFIDTSELTHKVPAGSTVLYRNPHKPADCIELAAGDALVISPANCPVTVMERKGTVLAMHTGRKCLVDHHYLEHGIGAPGRRNHSVCQTALERLGKPFDTTVKVFWGVARHFFPHDLNHPTFAKTNRALYELVSTKWGTDPVPRKGDVVYLDLPKLIKVQCMAWGVPEEHVDLSHAYQPPTGTWTNGKEGAGRNLVVIARHT